MAWTDSRAYSQSSPRRAAWQFPPRDGAQDDQKDGKSAWWKNAGQFDIPAAPPGNTGPSTALSPEELHERQAMFEQPKKPASPVQAQGSRAPRVNRTRNAKTTDTPTFRIRRFETQGKNMGNRADSTEPLTESRNPNRQSHPTSQMSPSAGGKPLRFQLHTNNVSRSDTQPQLPPDAASWSLLNHSEGQSKGANPLSATPEGADRSAPVKERIPGRGRGQDHTKSGKYVSLNQQACRLCGSKEHLSINCTAGAPTIRRIGSTVPAVDSATSSPPLDPEPRPKVGAQAQEPTTRAQQSYDFEPEVRRSRQYSPRSQHSGMEERPRRRVENTKRGHWDGTDREIAVDREIRRREKEFRRAQAAKQKRAEIILPEFISVSNLAQALGVHLDKFIDKMYELGFEDVHHDQVLVGEDAGLIAQEYGFDPQKAKARVEKDIFPAPLPEDKSSLPSRPPVVTIMGHVDHGKTTLLDYLRKSSVAAGEHGGITQHIGAFSVALSSGKSITFLDTPGHAAFLTMRARGANVTDIVILVVAADDSIMPQTVEAIKHAQSAKVPIIVAINKVDKEDANPQRVKHDLAAHGIEIEDFGGDTQTVLVSGKTGQGMAELEEATLTLSETLDHRGDPDGKVEGWILESSKKRDGLMATVLIRRGTLKPGDILVAGKTWTRVRRLMNEAGKLMSSVGPGMPAEIDGWRAQPEAGDEVLQAEDEHHAAQVTDHRKAMADQERMAKDMEAINEARRLVHERKKREKDGEAADESGVETTEAASAGPKTIPFVVKADVSGSVEAVVNVLSGIGNAEIRPNVIRSGVGPVTETDLDFAALANGHIVSFNTKVDPKFHVEAKRLGVDIIDQNIIYRVAEDIKAKLSQSLTPDVIQKVTGEAEIAQIFPINIKRKQVFIAGCKVKNGVITRNSKVKVLRDKKVVYQGMFNLLTSTCRGMWLTCSQVLCRP